MYIDRSEEGIKRLIDADNYSLELVRYIHNNPVRAGMVEVWLKQRLITGGAATMFISV